MHATVGRFDIDLQPGPSCEAPRMSRLRVLRVYHAAGVDAAREHALVAAGVDLTVGMPANWPGADMIEGVAARRLKVRRSGDVNRHVYADEDDLRRVLDEVRPDLL